MDSGYIILIYDFGILIKRKVFFFLKKKGEDIA